MATFFTSDTHFGHSRVLQLSKRPFGSVTDMDETMIAKWNAVVTPDDDVWHLGDFSSYQGTKLEGLFWRLNGRKRLVIGNHDEENEDVLILPWEEVPIQYTMIHTQGQRAFLCHYPMRSWPKIGKGAIHLFGHMHGSIVGTHQSTDVGVDCWDFRPVTLTDVQRRLRALPPISADDLPRGIDE